jgi:glycyl-tRNA synthetase
MNGTPDLYTKLPFTMYHSPKFTTLTQHIWAAPKKIFTLQIKIIWYHMAQQEDVFKKLVSHCKEYGFIFPSSEIYDGLGAVYDYGQNGVELKNNIKKYWWDSMTLMNENVVGIDSAIFMHPTIWKASGHVDAFNDPLIDNKDSKKRYRADVLVEEQIAKFEDKINKEIEKAAKRFGDAFDEKQFRETNPRVLENQTKINELHARFAKALNDNDLADLRQII